MIDLAPNHKNGLLVENPILLAGGMIGYGEALHRGVATERLGGVVVGPILQTSQGGRTGPRLAEVPGGFVLETGLQNRGINAVLKQFSALWPRLGCPVIAQLADDQPERLAKVAGRLTESNGVSGLELLLPRTATVDLVRTLLRAATRTNDLPVWVKVPLDRATLLAPAAVEAGAVGVVVGQPILGGAQPSGAGGQMGASASPLTGSLYGPLAFAPMLAALAAVARLQLPCALIACGGIFTVEQVRQALAVGAQAVQIDAAVWVEPGLPVRLVEALATAPMP
jgi:dihydroorotate dehydrogenase (NAD+) catalytic subunit